MAHLFSPYKVKDLTLRNRIVLSPMCTGQADDAGRATPWHTIHYGSRIVGGAGLIITEAVSVSPEGRTGANDLGLFNEDQVEPFARLMASCHELGGKIGVQLIHTGRKAHAHVGAVVGASPIPFSSEHATPEELSIEEIQRVIKDFAVAARRAHDAGADLIELHAAHGYIPEQFLSPLSNKRTDTYGGSFENRFRFTREVIAAIRAELPESKPLLVRISADEYSDEGLGIEEMIEVSGQLGKLGVDLIDVSSGGATPHAPRVFPGYQTGFAERIRREAAIPTMAVGLLDQPELANYVIESGAADLAAIGRGFLRNPYWGVEAAVKLGIEDYIPSSYVRAYR
ncbi:NADH:flavin oxidoreductase/NADH oxidase [Paenibacillus sp. GCM10023252]|uniref:NADH:flavin oxidoreductase/NADH oxidase n=1 Tax=Paenibacillus sp. GCM10023252 TaxID=3252649 RepID=UPI00360FDB24